MCVLNYLNSPKLRRTRVVEGVQLVVLVPRQNDRSLSYLESVTDSSIAKLECPKLLRERGERYRKMRLWSLNHFDVTGLGDFMNMRCRKPEARDVSRCWELLGVQLAGDQIKRNNFTTSIV